MNAQKKTATAHAKEASKTNEKSKLAETNVAKEINPTLFQEAPIKNPEPDILDIKNLSEEKKPLRQDSYPEKFTESPLLKDLEAKVCEYEELLKRNQADFENYRRRSLEERRQVAEYAAEPFLKGFLPILDTFEKALATQTTEENLKSFLQGFSFIKKQMDGFLTTIGLQKTTALDDEFDPHLHRALQIEEVANSETALDSVQKIVSIYEQGYRYRKHLLRTASVKIIKYKKAEAQQAPPEKMENPEELQKNKNIEKNNE